MSNLEDPVIAAQGLCKSFGDVVALRDVSFSVEAGEVLSLLGPNGAGKTTAVKLLTTLARMDRGSATVAGFDVASQPRAVRRSIGLAGQSAAVDEYLTAWENLEFFARLYKLGKRKRRARIDELIDLFDMADFADRPASTYSGGQRRRIDIAAALVATPAALFLDEPTSGLDPRSRAEVWDEIRTLARDGTAILLTTQYLDEADRLADQIVVIDRGQTVASGTPKDLKRKVGRDVLEVRMPTEIDFASARADLESAEGATFDPQHLEISVPIVGGAQQSLALLRRLEDQGVRIADFELRRPTLDDAFLALTGEHVPDEVGASS